MNTPEIHIKKLVWEATLTFTFTVTFRMITLSLLISTIKISIKVNYNLLDCTITDATYTAEGLR